MTTCKTSGEQLRYTPFNRIADDILATDLEELSEVREGWYVEYKSKPPNVRDIAKSLSSFANQYGGWLFFGVEEDPRSKSAARFPGIQNEDIPNVLELVRNAAKDVIRPQVAYQTHVIEGPLKAKGLNSGYSVIIVRVPEGSNTPYIHNDGRIYIRLGDSSSPISAKDKSTFDLLYQRGEDRRAYLKTLVERCPEISEGECDVSFIHLSIVSDPYETLGHWYEGSFSDFSDVMGGEDLPFDNIYTAPNGFVARQVETNNPNLRLFTWEFSRNCNSFVTIPLETLSLNWAVEERWENYEISGDFTHALTEGGFEASRILNLNLLPILLIVILSRHRTIVGQSGVRGPFYLKARIANVWRTIPFVDVWQYMEHLKEYSVPVVQEGDLIVPKGYSLETFVVSQEAKDVRSDLEDKAKSAAVQIWIDIMQALGIPGELIKENAQALLNAAQRESDIHRARRQGAKWSSLKLD